MWKTPELWRRRCYTPAEVTATLQAARLAVAGRKAIAMDSPTPCHTRRFPTATLVYDQGGNDYWIVTARVAYEAESNLEYAKRFRGNKPPPVVTKQIIKR